MRHLTALLLFLAMTAPAGAQLHFSLYTSHMYDDNSFAFYEKREDVYHALFGALSAGTQSKYTYVQGYYYGALVLFRTYSDRTYNIHTLGAYTQIQVSHRDYDEEHDQPKARRSSAQANEDAEQEGSGPLAPPMPMPQPDEATSFSDSLVSYLFIIPQVGGRFDHDNWDFYDFQRGSVLLRWRVHLFGSLMARLHHTVQYKRYPNLEQFTHLENTGGIILNHPLVRKLQMFAAVDAGHKRYTESMNDTTWNSDGTPGKGKGGVKPPRAVISQFSTPSTMQYVFSAGLVYALFPRAPLSLSWLRRSNPSSDARYVREDAIFGLTEDEIFDDRYGYQSNELRLRLDGVLPGDIRTMNSIELIRKQYPRTATDLAGVPLSGAPQREDARFVLRLQALYPLFRSDDGTGLSVGLAYNFIRNQSNNAYHDFHNHQVAVVFSGDW